MPAPDTARAVRRLRARANAASPRRSRGPQARCRPRRGSPQTYAPHRLPRVPRFSPYRHRKPNPCPLCRAMQVAWTPGATSKAERSNGHRAFQRGLVHRVTAAGIDDRAAIHHREMIPQLAREVEILLDQHHRDPPETAQIGDGAADVLDDRGLNTLGRL